MQHASYGRLAAMLLTSTTAMLGSMYSMVYRVDHLRWSRTRFWMALYMGATMAIIMLAFMLGMYTNRRRNAMIFGSDARLSDPRVQELARRSIESQTREVAEMESLIAELEQE